MALTLHRNRPAPVAAEAGPTVIHRRPYTRPAGAGLAGLVAVVTGAWAAVCVYVGPYFGFRPVETTEWVGSLRNGLLHLLPGAVAVAAGLLLMAVGPARRAARGSSLALPALLLMAAGAWLVIGPAAWPTFESGPAFHTGTGALRHLLDVACSSYAPGLLLAVLGGMALKAGMVRPVATVDPMTPVEAAPSESV